MHDTFHPKLVRPVEFLAMHLFPAVAASLVAQEDGSLKICEKPPVVEEPTAQDTRHQSAVSVGQGLSAQVARCASWKPFLIVLYKT